MLEKVKQVKSQVGRKKKDIAVTIVWAIAVTLIIVKTHQSFYLQNKKFSVYNIPYLHYEGAMFSDLDRLLLVAASFLVGFILVDTKSVIYGYFASMFLAFSMAVTYVSLYVWFVLGLGEALSLSPFGWEWAIFLGFINVFRFMFPIGLVMCLIGVVAGNFVRIWIRP